MLFIIFVAILVAGVILKILYEILPWERRRDWMDVAGCLGAWLGSTLVIGSLVVFGCSLMPAQANLDALEQTRASLVYQLENNLYDNDNDFGKKELMSEIQSFNESLVFHKKMQRDFWVGIYYANIYDDIQLIEINKS